MWTFKCCCNISSLGVAASVSFMSAGFIFSPRTDFYSSLSQNVGKDEAQACPHPPQDLHRRNHLLLLRPTPFTAILLRQNSNIQTLSVSFYMNPKTRVLNLITSLLSLHVLAHSLPLRLEWRTPSFCSGGVTVIELKAAPEDVMTFGS